MLSWTPYAFVRITLIFISGILAGIYTSDLLPIGILCTLFGMLLISLAVIAYVKPAGKLKNVAGFIGLFALFLSGFGNVFLSTDSHREHHLLNNRDTIAYYRALLIKQSQEKENSWKVEAEMQCAKRLDGTWKKINGKVILYFPKKDFAQPFQYGDVLLIRGHPQALKSPSNPGEFDYKEFLAYRKIYHQHFLRGKDAILISHEPPSTIVNYSILARQWAEHALKENINGKQEQATASALVLGVTDGLDNDLIGAYAATGSLHVLSVSGLHVGIIYWLFLLIFGPLGKTYSGKWILAFFSVVVLWGYAFVTGVSPSVLRAVMMFTFVAFARPWGRRTNIYNTLAASAFCLLLYEPYFIMSVGFQLSYLAVIGIVYLQPKLLTLWEPRTWLWNNIWQITCVSIAAQASTVALGLLYFHQFPVYFLVSNLFVIPASFVVLVLGIIVVFISIIPVLASAIGFLLEWTIRILNYGVFELEALPFSLIDNVYITTFQCWLLMGVIVLIVLLFESKRIGYFVAAAAFSIAFAGLQWNHFFKNVNRPEFTVYQLSEGSAWDIMENGRIYFFSDSVLIKNKDKIRFHIRPNRLSHGAVEIIDGKDQAFVRSLPGCRLVIWKGVKILQVEDKNCTIPINLKIDYVLLSRNAAYDIKILAPLKFKKLILDSSNSFYFAERIIKDARLAGIDVHSVLHQGAFIAKL